MRFIYAVGRPSQLEFGAASRPDRLPRGAKVFAVCDGARTEDRLDEFTFARMSDAEYYRLQSLVAAAREREARRPRGFRGLLGRLFGFTA